MPAAYYSLSIGEINQMASNQFQEKFRHKASLVSKLGELDVSHSRPANLDNRSPFLKAGVAIAQAVQPRLEQPLVFAKPIRINKKSLEETYVEFPEQVLTTPSVKAASEPATSGHRLNRSIGFVESPAPTRHQRKASMPLQDTKPRAVDFLPYTLEDYRRLKDGGKWVALGGIGPRSHENEDWQRSHYVHKRRTEYARQLRGGK